jgi:hypothetical protein
VGFTCGYMGNFSVVLDCGKKSFIFLLETLYMTGESCYSFTTSHRGGGWKRGNEMNQITKTGIRTDMKYVREVLSQISDALKENDYAEVAFLANDAGACLIGIMELALAQQEVSA